MKISTPTLGIIMSLPPFGKILLAYQASKVALDKPIYIHIGQQAREHCFAQVKHGDLASFISDDISLKEYVWPIHDQCIYLIDHGGLSLLSLQKICLYLLKHKPRIIYVWSQEHPCQFFKGSKK